LKAIIDISSSPTDAQKYHSRMGTGVEFLSKGAFSKRRILDSIRKLRQANVEDLYFFCTSRHNQYNLLALKLIALASGARRVFLSDSRGDTELSPRSRFFPYELPSVIAALLYGFVVVITLPVLYLMAALCVLCGLAPRRARIGKDKRLCYLRTDFWFDIQAGGSLTHTRGFINAGIDLGYKVDVLSVDPLTHYALKTKVMLIKPSRLLQYLPVQFAQLDYNFRLLIRSWAYLRHQRPNVFYQRISENNFAGVLLALVWRAPLVLEFNASSAWESRHWQRSRLWWFESLLEWLNLRGAYRIAVVSAELRRALLESALPQDKIIVNPNGVDPIQFSNAVEPSPLAELSPVGTKWIGFAGIFAQWHGVLTLARSVKHVVQMRPNARFLIVGDGVLKEEMLRIVREDQVESHVKFTGLLKPEDVPKFLNICEVLLSPHEDMANGATFFGSPTKIFEYMAMGKGIVASRVGQLGELLVDGRDALLVEPGNVKQLAENIVQLLEHPELCHELGRQARAKVLAEYTWDQNFCRIASSLGR